MFRLRGEIGTCPNIEVEIDVMAKLPFFIRPYHVKEEDKNFIGKEMKCLCYLGILKEGFLAYSSPLGSRLEVVQKLQPSTAVNGCRSFAGMVNFVLSRIANIIETCI